MSDDWIYDYDEDDLLYQMDDDYAIGADGHIVQNAGDNLGFDVTDGDFHMTTGWSASDEDHDDDEDSAWCNGNSSSCGETGGRVSAAGAGEPWGDDTQYRFCLAAVAKDGRKYFYRALDPSIQAGDYVIVPEMNGAGGIPARVLEAKFYSRNEVPVPLATAKCIKRKIDAETYFALTENASRKAQKGEERLQKDDRAISKSAENNDAHSTESDRPSPIPSSQQKQTKKPRIILYILIGVLAIIVIAALALAVLNSQTPPGTKAETETPEPIAAAEIVEETIPAVSVNRLTDTETDNRITEVLEGLEEVSNAVAGYGKIYWEPESVLFTLEDARYYERKWSGYLEDMNGLLEILKADKPSAEYAEPWDKLKIAVQDIAYVAELLSDFDIDNNGAISVQEFSEVNEDANDAALDVQVSLADFQAAYEAAQTTPTPVPTTRPKSSISQTNSDPYNAGDYNDPEFFYDDYYDDFSDYDEAEQYWEEFGD